MMDKLVLDRRPGVIRKPFKVPTPRTATLWQDADALVAAVHDGSRSGSSAVLERRPPMGNGAPGRECPPEHERRGPGRLQDPRSTSRARGAGTRTARTASSYQWLRDGAPLPLYNGPPIGSKPGCTVRRAWAASTTSSSPKTPVTSSAARSRSSTTRTRRRTSSPRKCRSWAARPTHRSRPTCPSCRRRWATCTSPPGRRASPEHDRCDPQRRDPAGTARARRSTT